MAMLAAAIAAVTAMSANTNRQLVFWPSSVVSGTPTMLATVSPVNMTAIAALRRP